MSAFYKFRYARPTDLNFILGTFRDSMRDDSALAKSVKTSLFKREFTRVIDSILSKSWLKIACTIEDENVILGYIVYEKSILHYLFVKEPFRRKGIAKALTSEAFHKLDNVECSLRTNTAKRILEIRSDIIYNPFLLYRQELSSESKSS